MAIKVIFFDLDDTLIYEKSQADEAFLATIRPLEEEYNINSQKFIALLKENARDLWHSLPTYDYVRKIGISSWEALWANFIGKHEMLKQLSFYAGRYQFETWHNTLSEFNINNSELASFLSKKFHRERRIRHKVKPDSIEVLKKLREGFLLGCITNGTPDLQHEKIIGCQLHEYFNHIIISGEVDYGKPDEKIFSIALKKFNVSGKESIMVGDTLKTDIVGAKNAGFVTIWLNEGKLENDNEIKPHYEIDNIKKLLKLIKKIS